MKVFLIVVLLSGCTSLNQTHNQQAPTTHKQSAYQKEVKQFASYLDEKGFSTAGIVLAVSAIEPLQTLVSSLRLYRGQTPRFHEYHANPKFLTPEQAHMRPVLLLHGDKHNQSAFIPMLAYFYKKKYKGPVFTVNIPSNKHQKTQLAILEKKLSFIDDLYQAHGVLPIQNEAHLRTLLIGHSLGADHAIEIESQDNTQRPLILIGALKHSNRKQAQVYINAVNDEVLQLPSQIMDNIQPTGEVLEVNTGHLGLLSHPKVLKKCYAMLTSEAFRGFP